MPEPVRIEVKIAREDAALEAGVEKLGEPSIYACPECHGVLLQLKEGGRIRFRCHTGHAYSTEALIADMDRSIEDSLWNSIRTLQEKALLARHLEQHAREQKQSATADMLDRLARHAEERASVVRRAVYEAEVTEPHNVESTDAGPVPSERRGSG